MADPVVLDIADSIARITFNRADRLNALNRATAEGFEAAVQTVLETPGVSVVILSGAGRSFMAGGDLAEFKSADDMDAAIRAVMDPVHRALVALAASPVISICAAQGPIAGAGMSFVLGTDLAVGAEGMSLNMAYIRLGTNPDCGGTYYLPRLVGLRRAIGLTLLSDTVTDHEALATGLLNRLVPADDLEAEVDKIAARLANGPAVAQGSIKTLMRKSLDNDLQTQLDAEQAGFLHCAATADFAEGLEAFFAKRKPEFQGR
jgi:2-(1,2-epoxy-1,2-dihydrophenyl)acetyl-CoA isomerase